MTQLQTSKKTQKGEKKQKTLHKKGVFYKIAKKRKLKYLHFGS